MKCLIIQLQSYQCELPDVSHLVHTLAANIKSHHDTANVSVTAGNDSDPYTDITIETHQLAELWACIGSLVVEDEVVSSYAIVCCEGENHWDDYLLLYHYDKSVTIDTLS